MKRSKSIDARKIEMWRKSGALIDGRRPVVVFLTIIGALRAFLEGMVEGFEGALFYFDYSRDFFFSLPTSNVRDNPLPYLGNKDKGRVMAAYRLLRAAVLHAEKIGRVSWVKIDEYQKVGVLNAMLEANGMPTYPDDDKTVLRRYGDVSRWFEVNCPETVRVIFSGMNESPSPARAVTKHGRTSLIRNGVRITVVKEGKNFTTDFSYIPGNIRVRAIRGVGSREEALKQGIAFIKAHQYRFVERIGVYRLSVRLGWEGKWGYLLECEGSMIASSVGFQSEEEAVTQGRVCGREKNDRLDREIEEITRRTDEWRASVRQGAQI